MIFRSNIFLINSSHSNKFLSAAVCCVTDSWVQTLVYFLHQEVNPKGIQIKLEFGARLRLRPFYSLLWLDINNNMIRWSW
jgi:hypothetical protein